jgi:integrase
MSDFVKVVEGIYKKPLKNGDVSWYRKMRVNNVSTWVKIGSKNKNNLKGIKDVISFINQNNELKIENEQDKIPIGKVPTLNALAKIYFDNRLEIQKSKIIQEHTHLSFEEIDKLVLTKQKLYNIKKEINTYKKNIEKTEMAKMPLDMINSKALNNFMRQDFGFLKISQKTKWNIITQLKTIVNFAIRQELITKIINPFNSQIVKVKNPKKMRNRVLNEEELTKLLKEAKKNNHNVYMPIYLALLTAGRANTILNIRKKDIDLKNRTIYLNNIKASKKYTLELNEGAIKWFEKILQDYEYDEYLVRCEKIEFRKIPYRPMRKLPQKVFDIMDDLFNEHLNKQDNGDRDNVVNFHSIRRSVATNLVKHGATLYDVMKFLDHSSVQQTEKYLNLKSKESYKIQSLILDRIFENFEH